METVEKHGEAGLSGECGSIVDTAEWCKCVAPSDLLLVLSECREGKELVGPFRNIEELMVSLNSNGER